MHTASPPRESAAEHYDQCGQAARRARRQGVLQGQAQAPRAHGDLGRAVTREQHVGGLEVEVDDALVVQVVQPARDLQRNPPAPGAPAVAQVTVMG